MRETLVAAAWVAGGGALGALARWAAGQAGARLWGIRFPWATLALNLLGSLILGVVVGLIEGRFAGRHEPLRLAVAIGFLGSFTTFSTFALETDRLLETGEGVRAALYVAASAGLAVGAVRVGMWLSGRG